MTRLVLALLVAIVMLLAAMAYGEAGGFPVRCLLTATDQEAMEGYYNCGAELAIVTKPNSSVHDDLQRMLGHEVVVVVETR